MKTEIEVQIKTDKYMGQVYTEYLTQIFRVTTYDDEPYRIVESITEFVHKNYDSNCTLQITVNDIYDPSMVAPITSSLGESLLSYLPFNIELGENVLEPKDYDPIWV